MKHDIVIAYLTAHTKSFSFVFTLPHKFGIIENDLVRWFHHDHPRFILYIDIYICPCFGLDISDRVEFGLSLSYLSVA